MEIQTEGNETRDSSVTKNTCLLRNLIYKKAWDTIEQECQTNPKQAKMADRLGDLPLHEACLQAAPYDVIKNLLVAHPEGVKKRGFCGRLPLHYASYIKPRLKVVKLLLKKYPEGASEKDSDGRLPVHLAVVRNAPEAVIKTLVLAFPESLITQNKFGSTPQMLARTDYLYSIFEDKEVKSNKEIKRKVRTAPSRVITPEEAQKRRAIFAKAHSLRNPMDINEVNEIQSTHDNQNGRSRLQKFEDRRLPSINENSKERK